MTPTPDPTPADAATATLALDRPRDARSRALRTAFQFLIVTVLVDLIPVLTAALEEDAGPLDVGRLIRAGVRIVLGAVLALVMRYFTPPAD